MSFEIDGFAPVSSADASAGLLVLRFNEPTPEHRLKEVASDLEAAGVLESGSVVGSGDLAALAWRVPSSDEVDAQRAALSKISGVAKGWAFSQGAEADLSDWFAPTWRNAPPSSKAFADARKPEHVSWEGFGIALRFDREVTESERQVVRALAELWLTAYSDRSTRAAQGPLGGQCYRRAVIAAAGPRGVVVGLEGLANPGTDEEAIDHARWLAEQVGRIVAVESIEFVRLLPQAGESGEAIAPAVVLERTTREWRGESATELVNMGTIAEPAAAETSEVDAVSPTENDDLDDDSWAVETKHLPRADDLLAEAIATRSNGVNTRVEIQAAPAHPDDNTVELDSIALGLVESYGEITAAPDAITVTDDDDGSDGVHDAVTTTGAIDDVTNQAAIANAIEGGDLDAALAAYDAAVDKSAGVEILSDVIESLDPADWDEIPQILHIGERILPTQPERSSAYLQTIAALCRMGRGAEAIDLGLSALDHPGVLFETFERLVVFRRTDEAADLIGRLAEEQHEGAGNHYFNLGCKLHQSAPKVATALYHGAIACGSPRPQADINLGLGLMSLGELEESCAVTSKGLADCGDEPNLWANLIDAQARLASPNLEASLTKARAVLAAFEDDEVDSPAASEHGWGALVADMADAMLGGGHAEDALALIEGSSGQSPSIPRVVCAHGRALAAVGRVDEARELLDHVETADATSSEYYRARANVMFQAGNRDAAIGLACAAALADAASLEQLRRDPIGEAVADLRIADDGSPPRPPSVPDSAVWVASDREWEFGDTGPAGEKQGPFRYYRADGTLCNECTMVDGKPHGPFVRFHESGEVSQEGAFEEGQLHGTRKWLASETTTTEIMHNEHISTLIRRSEMDYVKGRVVSVRHYNAEGTLSAPNGEPYPDRPGDVSADAFFKAEEAEWASGEVDDEGKRRGTWKRWDEQGVLLEGGEYTDGEPNGSFRAFFSDGTLSAEGQFKEGEKVGTFVYQRRGENEHEDFPVAGESVSVAEVSHDTTVPGIRYYDRSGREVTIDGTPLEEWTSTYPELKAWFNDLWLIPWPELDDASGNAHRVPHLMLGLASTDNEIGEYVLRALYWHLYHEGTVYSGTAAAVPFLVTLAEASTTPRADKLCSFIRHASCYAQDALDEAAEGGQHAVISTNEALRKRIDPFLAMMTREDPAVRASAAAVLTGALDRADEMASQLSGALATETSEMVRASHMFSLARVATPEAMFVVEAQLDGDSTLVGACAAMALVMSRGEDAGTRVADRLVASLVDYNDAMGEAYAQSPWSDDHIVTEMTQALHYSCEGNQAMLRLADCFDKITTESGTAAVAATLMIASSSDDGLTDEIKQLLRAIADCDSLWTLGTKMVDLLEGYELPASPEGLREMAE